MNQLSYNAELNKPFDIAIADTTEALKEVGFGVLTRIDFDQKIKEKLGHSLPRTVVLGACNPKLAYEAYLFSHDMLLLIPCNVSIEEIGPSKSLVRMIKPSELLAVMGSPELKELAKQADKIIEGVAQKLSN